MPLVRRGEAAAFEVLYERHSAAAFSLAYRMVGARGVAEDVVREAFLSIWRSGARYDSARGSVRTWVLGVVHHRGIDALRRAFVHERRRAGTEGVPETGEGGTRTDGEAAGRGGGGGEAARREEAARVRDALEELPPEQCQVIELAYFGGFTHTEIAEMLDTPVGTVKGRMRLGPDKLRSRLRGEVSLG